MEIPRPPVVVQAVSRETVRRAHLSMALERYDELRCKKQMESWREPLEPMAAFAAKRGSSRLEALDAAIKEIEEALGLDGLMA
jgi:hypothetical protein